MTLKHTIINALKVLILLLLFESEKQSEKLDIYLLTYLGTEFKVDKLS